MRFIFFFQAEDGIRDKLVSGVQTCALPILHRLNSDDTGLQQLCLRKCWCADVFHRAIAFPRGLSWEKFCASLPDRDRACVVHCRVLLPSRDAVGANLPRYAGGYSFYRGRAVVDRQLVIVKFSAQIDVWPDTRAATIQNGCADCLLRAALAFCHQLARLGAGTMDRRSLAAR